jgi:carboxylesterase type B
MKGLSWQTLLGAQNWGAVPYLLNNTWTNVIHKLIWTPTIDGQYITQTPSTAFQTGNFYKIPVMLGTVSNETAGFLPLALGDGPGTPVLSAAFYKYGFDTLFGSNLAAKVRNFYPSSRTDSEDAISRALTDFAFICPVLQSATWMSQYVPVYVYQFSHKLECDPNNYQNTICKNRVCHSADVDFVFHTFPFDRRGGCSWTNEESQLSWQMLYTWTNFTSQPAQIASIPKWTGNNVLQFDTPISISDNLGSNANCGFWYDVVTGNVN